MQIRKYNRIDKNIDLILRGRSTVNYSAHDTLTLNLYFNNKL